MIAPRVGLTLLFWDDVRLRAPRENPQPLAATVSFVHADGSVNLSVSRANGEVEGRTRIAMWDGDGPVPATPCAFIQAIGQATPPTLSATAPSTQGGPPSAAAIASAAPPAAAPSTSAAPAPTPEPAATSSSQSTSSTTAA